MYSAVGSYETVFGILRPRYLALACYDMYYVAMEFNGDRVRESRGAAAAAVIGDVVVSADVEGRPIGRQV